MHEMPVLRGGVTVQALSRPARTFTGDFYFTHREGDRLWLVQGDVAGKGLPAAVVMAMIQEEIEHRIIACASTMCDPATTMTRLHEFLLPLLPSNRFATAVIGWLEESGTLRIANAGHCPPLILRSNGAIEEIGSTGPIIGLLRDARWSSVSTHLGPADTLLLYSDGVIEGLFGDRELGVAGLRQMLAQNPDPRALLDSLHMTDDATIVTVNGVRP